jgi:hypothetical protein
LDGVKAFFLVFECCIALKGVFEIWSFAITNAKEGRSFVDKRLAY